MKTTQQYDHTSMPGDSGETKLASTHMGDQAFVELIVPLFTSEEFCTSIYVPLLTPVKMCSSIFFVLNLVTCTLPPAKCISGPYHVDQSGVLEVWAEENN